MDIVSLETIIKRYIKLPNHPSGTGWYPVGCKVCNDHMRKGPRGGFRFDDNKVAYHCFNCNISTVYDPGTQKNLPGKMIQVLRDFNVPEEEWQQVLLSNMVQQEQGNLLGSTQTNKTVGSDIEPAVIPLPKHFYPLAEASPNDPWAQLATAYLSIDRGVEPTSYPFMLANWLDPILGDPNINRWFKRVIIPIYKDKNPIFYIGRDLTGKLTQKYLSPSFSKEKVLFGFDELFRQTEEPLYIVEGWFDAFAINGVAILGNEISDAHVTWLNRSQRKKVYIPDRFGDGKQAAQQALKLGWSVATPGQNTWSDEIKDMNDAVMKYGRMFVMKSLVETTATGFTAEANLGFYCRYDDTNKNRSKKKNRTTSSSKRTRR